MVRARGRVEVAAYGTADAEHLVEKEMAGLWPGSRLRVESISRPGPVRIVEEFSVSYLVVGEVEVAQEASLKAAFSAVRGRLAGSRFAAAELEGG